MFKVIKLLLSMGSLAAFAWFGLTVRLGDHTFFGHVRSIAGSRESQDLVKGTKETVSELLERPNGPNGPNGQAANTQAPPGAGKAPRVAGGSPPVVPTAPPQEELTDRDREDMRKLLGSRSTGGKAK